MWETLPVFDDKGVGSQRSLLLRRVGSETRFCVYAWGTGGGAKNGLEPDANKMKADDTRKNEKPEGGTHPRWQTGPVTGEERATCSALPWSIRVTPRQGTWLASILPVRQPWKAKADD